MPRGPRWGRVGGHAPRPPPPGRPRPSPPRRRGRPRTAHAQKQTPSPPHAGARSEAARGAGTRKRRKRLGPRSAAAFNGRAGPGQRPAPRRCVRPPRRGCGGRGAGGRGPGAAILCPARQGREGRNAGGGRDRHDPRSRPDEGGGPGAPSLPPSWVPQGPLRRPSAPRRTCWRGDKGTVRWPGRGRREPGARPRT